MTTALRQLIDGLPDGMVVTDPATTENYRFDQARFCPAGQPLAVVRPTATEHVVHVMKVASQHGIPVVPQGAQSGLSGGANALEGSIVLNMMQMNRIVSIDEVEQIAVVEPGVFNAELSRAVLEKGLFYPPDPSSWEISTIGGNLATNAGGLCCVKYGVTSDYVRALEVVLPTGEVLHTGRVTAKGVAGYDLTRLLVGSEGTLGVITQATLRLIPAPAEGLTAVAVFTDAASAARAVADIMASPIRPSLLEFMDKTTIKAVNDYKHMGFSEDAGALLLAQSDRGDQAPDDLAAMSEIFERNGAIEVAVADDVEESGMLMEARRIIHWALDVMGATFVEDVAVPRGRMVELLDGIDAIAQKYQLTIPCPGHAGDGNLHPTVIFERGNPESERAAVAAFGDVMQLALSLGGTITGEHGVGELKSEYLVKELGPVSTRIQRDMRRVFDPQGILNPGRVI